jgi:hypothetical protein
MPNQELSIKLPRAEALVVFAMIRRFSETDGFTVEDSAEAQVLDNLLERLQKILPDPLGDEYADLLSKARKQLGQKKG